MPSLWITGSTRSGKTARLIDTLLTWGNLQSEDQALDHRQSPSANLPWLIFAANGDNRMMLANRLADVLRGQIPYTTRTPAGFIQNEVILFWPLLVTTLRFRAQFPLKLRPENEQLLATQLWQPALTDGSLLIEGWREAQTVRRILDFLQLAASAGIAIEDIPTMLQQGMVPNLAPAATWETIGKVLLDWRDWCLDRGLLTYGLMTALYWRHLLPHPQYQAQLLERFQGILADDLDEYPAITVDLCNIFLNDSKPCCFTYNPNGKVRLGVSADPDATEALAETCELISLSHTAQDSLGYAWTDLFLTWVNDPLAIPDLPDTVALIQGTTRGKMLRETAEYIADAIYSGQVEPQDVAVIGPGLDAIARYSLIEILGNRGIAIKSLNDQRPLISSPLVRALLSLLALVFPGLGRLVNRDAVAEMLVVLSQSPILDAGEPWFDLTQIDPVRAELIADHCFVPDIENPHLLPVENFPRWDRLGYKATTAYQRILDWLNKQKPQLQYPQKPVLIIDRIIQDFLWRGNYLPIDQLSALRELTETAQYFWEVEDRLKLFGGLPQNAEINDVGRFIQLLQRGTISANPYPIKPLDPKRQGVTLATVFQYRAQRLTHRWQFWLDAGSPRWLTGKDELFGAAVFLKNWSGHPVTAADTEAMHEARLERILRDLLGRTTARLFLCHSDLALNGQEQMGPLLSLLNLAQPVNQQPASLEALNP